MIPTKSVQIKNLLRIIDKQHIYIDRLEELVEVLKQQRINHSCTLTGRKK